MDNLGLAVTWLVLTAVITFSFLGWATWAESLLTSRYMKRRWAYMKKAKDEYLSSLDDDELWNRPGRDQTWTWEETKEYRPKQKETSDENN